MEISCAGAISELFTFDSAAVESDGSASLLQLVDAGVVGMNIDQPPADDRRDGGAVQRASVKRRVAALRFRAVHIENPLELRIENRDVRVSAFFQ